MKNIYHEGKLINKAGVDRVVLSHTRCLDKQKLLVCCNFRDVESQMEFTQEWKSGRKILGNYEENHKNNYKVLTLRPYEIIVLEKGEE